MFYDSFESSEWTHSCKIFPTNGEPYNAEVGNIFVPEGYTFWFKHGYPVEHDVENNEGWCQPEAHYSRGFDTRVFDGEQSFQWFGFFKIFDAGIYRKFNASGSIEVKLRAHAWSSTDDNPDTSDDVDGCLNVIEGTPGLTDAQRNIVFYVGIDPTGGEDPFSENIIWSVGRHIYNEFAELCLNTQVTGEFTLFVRAKSLWRFKHNDVYIDGLEINSINSPSCGEPRVDYERTYHLLPFNISDEHFEEITSRVLGSKATLGFSADDAGIGCLSNKNVVVYWETLDSWPSENALNLFFSEYYPGTSVAHVHFNEEVPPDPGPVYGSNLGMHILSLDGGLEEYYSKVKPKVAKVFSAGDATEIKSFYPETRVVFRRLVDDDFYYTHHSNPEQAAKELVDLYAFQLDDFGEDVDYVESVNEVISHSQGENDLSVIFDVAFAEELHRRYPHIGPVLFTAPVGNPHEDQFLDFLPVVEKVCEYNGAIGYHAYWWGDEEESGLESSWPWYAGRWTEMDKVWTAAGFYPKYILGEAAVIYSANKWDLGTGQGWKRCGNIHDYGEDLFNFNRLISEWNLSHNYRCLGATIFTVGGWGGAWENFRLREEELLVLSQLLE